jgi:hypothetical protein
MLDWEWKSFSDSSAQRQLATNAGLKLMRLFSVRIEPCTQWVESSKTGTFNWAKVDTLLQRIFAAGAEPLICFGKFGSAGGKLEVPRGMANNPATNLPYPASYAAYVAEWVKHFKTAGLTVRYYEIVNEPYFYFGWDTAETKLIGNFADLFNTVARNIRSINPNVLIGNDAFLQKKFLNYFVNYGDNLDFIDFHKYGLGEQGGTDAAAFNQARTAYLSTETQNWYTLDQARQIWSSKRGKTLPTIITESNFSYAWTNGSDPRIQQMAGAVYTALVAREAVLRGIDYDLYYAFASSASTQDGSGKGYGLINCDNNQPWYPYYVYLWLGQSLGVGDKLFSLTSSFSGISGFAWNHDQRTYFLFICEANQAVTVYFNGLSGNINFSKIDNTISYLTPKVQTGTISSTQSFAINGYTVAIFQGTPSTQPPPPSPPPPSTSYFTDGFESGNFGNWAGTTVSSGETVTVTAATVHTGLYSGRFTSNGATGEEKAYCYKSVNLGEAYLGGYFNIGGLPLVDNGDRLYLLRLSGTQTLVYAGIRRDAGVDRWVVIVRNGASWINYASNVSATLPQTGKWFSLELHWKMSSSNGLVELYVNNIKTIVVSGVNTGYYGNATRADFGLPYLGAVQKSITVYADDAVISQSYVGL